MKRRLVSLLLALVLAFGLLPVTVLADWTSFRGSSNNMAITNAQTPTEAAYTELSWTAAVPGEKATGQPVIAGDVMFVTRGETISKLKLEDGSVLQSGDMSETAGYFNTIAPALDEKNIYVALMNGVVAAFDRQTLTEQWSYTDELKGQNQCSVLVSGGRIYTGFWNAEEKDANFVCLDAETGEKIWSHTQKGGFYWTGAVAVEDYIFVGTDDGAKDSTGTSYLLSFHKDQKNGTPVSTLTLKNCGDQRSALAYSNGRVYFTTKGGYLCSAAVDGTTGEITDLKTVQAEIDGKAYQATSTPVVYNGYVYYGIGKPNGYFVIAKENEDKSLTVVRTLEMKGYPQSSPLLSTAYERSEGYLYFYMTYNTNPGGLSCIRVLAKDPSKARLTELYDAKGYEQYCIGSPICGEDGTIYYKNDTNRIFALKKSTISTEVNFDPDTPLKYKPNAAAQALTVTAVSSEEKTLSYQWQSSTDGSSWENIDGANKASYTPVIGSEPQTVYYRCVVTDSEGASAVTPAATVIVKVLNEDTTLYYAINESNTAPDNKTANNYAKREPTALEPGTTIVDMGKLKGTMYGIQKTGFPRVWLKAPENGEIVSVKVSAEKDKVSEGTLSATSTSAYHKTYYKLDNAKDGLQGNVVLEVKTRAEDTSMEATYTLVLSPDGKYTPPAPPVLERTAYVTIVNSGTVVLAQKKLTVTDADKDGKVTVDEVLRAAHETYCPGGYDSAGEDDSLFVTKLWGDTSGAFTYWNENVSCWSAANAVSEDGHVVAFVYKDKESYSDKYAYFDDFDYKTTTDTALAVTLTAAGYDADWNPVFAPCTGAAITAYAVSDGQATGTALDENAYSVTETSDGYEITFSEAGSYYLVATNDSANIVPAVCTVTVTSDEDELEKILEQIGALGDSTEDIEPDEATYEKLSELESAIRGLSEETNRETANNALAPWKEAFEEALNVEKSTATENRLSAIYDKVVEDAEKDGVEITEALKKDLNAIMIEAEDDIKRANHTGEINQILRQAKIDLEAATQRIHVSFRLVGDFLHDGEDEEHAEYVTWMETKRYAVSREATVLELFQQALGEAKLDESGSDSGYVSSVRAPDILGSYWLSEMDNGPNAGWVYCVNGEYPEVGLDQFTLEEGDKVVWHYVDDYTDEDDMQAWRRAADISPKDYAKDRVEKIVSVTGKGKVGPQLDFSDFGMDVEFTFEPEENQELLEVTVDGVSIGAPERYTYEKLNVKSRIRATFTGKMRFTDVRKKDWFYEDVEYVVENGLFHGTSKTTFSPNAPMTRGMLVTVLYRLAEQPETTAASSFTDVAKEQYYAQAIAWAAENGIVSGVSQTSFAPDSEVTREQLAAILYRFAKKQGYGTDKTNDLGGYADAEAISAYAIEALGWANAEKLVNGRSETELSPQGQATRAEVAAILHRFAETVAK